MGLSFHRAQLADRYAAPPHTPHVSASASSQSNLDHTSYDQGVLALLGTVSQGRNPMAARSPPRVPASLESVSLASLFRASSVVHNRDPDSGCTRYSALSSQFIEQCRPQNTERFQAQKISQSHFLPDGVEGYRERIQVALHIAKVAKQRLDHIVKYASPHVLIQLNEVAASYQLVEPWQEHLGQDRFAHVGQVVAHLNDLVQILSTLRLVFAQAQLATCRLSYASRKTTLG